jgi:hypothetical protein
MMEAIRSSDTSFLTNAIRRNIPEDGILEVVISSVLSETAVQFTELLFLLVPVRRGL